MGARHLICGDDSQALGVDGVVVIGHGRPNARAVFSAIRAAVQNHVLRLSCEVAAEIPARKSSTGASVEEDD